MLVVAAAPSPSRSYCFSATLKKVLTDAATPRTATNPIQNVTSTSSQNMLGLLRQTGSFGGRRRRNALSPREESYLPRDRRSELPSLKADLEQRSPSDIHWTRLSLPRVCRPVSRRRFGETSDHRADVSPPQISRPPPRLGIPHPYYDASTNRDVFQQLASNNWISVWNRDESATIRNFPPSPCPFATRQRAANAILAVISLVQWHQSRGMRRNTSAVASPGQPTGRVRGRGDAAGLRSSAG